METGKLGVGEMIAAVCAVALFVFMFLPWYGVDGVTGIDVGTFGGSASAWEALTVVDLVLFVVCVVVVGVVLIDATESQVDLPRPPGQMIAVAGALAFVLIVFRLIVAPGVDTGGFDVDVDVGREIGLFLALLAAAGIAYGGWRATEQESPPRGAPPDAAE